MPVLAVYTLEELAALWKVAMATLEHWLELERAAGRGPSLRQYVCKLARGRVGPKIRLIRADYASYIQDRYVFRVHKRRAKKAVVGFRSTPLFKVNVNRLAKVIHND